VSEKCPKCGAVLSVLAELAAERERAEKIVGRLETTADKVPLCPGDTAWLVAREAYGEDDDSENPWHVIEAKYLVDIEDEDGQGWEWTAVDKRIRDSFEIDSIWSTRAAAEASKEKA
jgi:hypothetical protein